MSRCADRLPGGRLLLAHETWTKVHTLAPDRGWRPFAPAGNLTVVLNMNLADRRVRALGEAAWRTAHAEMGALRTSVLPPLLYQHHAARKLGEAFATPRNPRVAAMHHTTCPWGGCHPPRGGPTPEWPGWRRSAPCQPEAVERAHERDREGAHEGAHHAGAHHEGARAETCDAKAA